MALLFVTSYYKNNIYIASFRNFKGVNTQMHTLSVTVKIYTTVDLLYTILRFSLTWLVLYWDALLHFLYGARITLLEGKITLKSIPVLYVSIGHMQIPQSSTLSPSKLRSHKMFNLWMKIAILRCISSHPQQYIPEVSDL